MNIRSIINAHIVWGNLPMDEVHGWSRSAPNFFGKLRRGLFRYHESGEATDILSCDGGWEKRTDGGW